MTRSFCLLQTFCLHWLDWSIVHTSASKIPHNQRFDICYVLADKIASQEYFGFARIKQYTYIVTNIYAKLSHILKSLTAVLQKIPQIESLFFYQPRVLLGCLCISSHANARGCLTDLFGSLAGGLCIVHVEVHVQNHGEGHKDCSGNEHSFAQRLTGPVTSIYHIPILGVVCILCCSSN